MIDDDVASLFARLLCDIMIPAQLSEAIRLQGYDVLEARMLPVETQQDDLLAKLLREARDTDVWKFTSPDEVWRKWPDLSRHLGRRRKFWELLLECWQKEGLIGK